MLSEQAVTEFKSLYLNRYGIALSDQDAFEKASRLLTLYKTVLFPNKNMKPDHAQAIYPQIHTK